MPKVFEGQLSAAGLRFAIVVSRFNSFITDRLLGGAMDALTRAGADPELIDIVKVPGSWEVPLVTGELARQPRYDAVIDLVRGTVEYLAEVDDRITRHAEHWRMERMPAVDRNILRLAVYEMTHGGTPAPVTIDEALELARKFSNEESVQFVNGVLDAVRREMPEPNAPPARLNS